MAPLQVGYLESEGTKGKIKGLAKKISSSLFISAVANLEEKELLEHDKKGLLLAMKMAVCMGKQDLFEEAYQKYVAIVTRIRELRKKEASYYNLKNLP